MFVIASLKCLSGLSKMVSAIIATKRKERKNNKAISLRLKLLSQKPKWKKTLLKYISAVLGF